jgi:hypothetical protein
MLHFLQHDNNILYLSQRREDVKIKSVKISVIRVLLLNH